MDNLDTMQMPNFVRIHFLDQKVRKRGLNDLTPNVLCIQYFIYIYIYIYSAAMRDSPGLILCRGTDGPAVPPSPFAASPTADENHCTWRSFHSLALSARNQKLPRANLITAVRQSTATVKQKCYFNCEYENDLSGCSRTRR